MEAEFLGRFCYHKLTAGDRTTPPMLIFNTINCSRLGKRNAAGGVEGIATFRVINAVPNPMTIVSNHPRQSNLLGVQLYHGS